MNATDKSLSPATIARAMTWNRNDPTLLINILAENTTMEPRITNDDIQLATLFDSLKTGQLVTVSFTSCMGRTNSDGVQLKVGRKTHSKKYNVTTIFLERVDGTKVPTWVKPKLLMRHNDNRRVSMSHGDMAVQLHSITVNN